MTIDKKSYDVKLKVKNMSFSAHADSKGILNLLHHCEPENVVLVHGEKSKMEIFSEVVKETLKIPCFFPANFEDLYIPVKARDQSYPVALGKSLAPADYSTGLDLSLLLVKTGDGLSGKMLLEKELVVRKRKAANGEVMDEASDDDREVRILPHKITKFSPLDYK